MASSPLSSFSAMESQLLAIQQTNLELKRALTVRVAGCAATEAEARERLVASESTLTACGVTLEEALSLAREHVAEFGARMEEARTPELHMGRRCRDEDGCRQVKRRTGDDEQDSDDEDEPRYRSLCGFADEIDVDDPPVYRSASLSAGAILDPTEDADEEGAKSSAPPFDWDALNACCVKLTELHTSAPTEMQLEEMQRTLASLVGLLRR